MITAFLLKKASSLVNWLDNTGVLIDNGENLLIANPNSSSIYNYDYGLFIESIEVQENGTDIDITFSRVMADSPSSTGLSISPSNTLLTISKTSDYLYRLSYQNEFDVTDDVFLTIPNGLLKDINDNFLDGITIKASSIQPYGTAITYPVINNLIESPAGTWGLDNDSITGDGMSAIALTGDFDVMFDYAVHTPQFFLSESSDIETALDFRRFGLHGEASRTHRFVVWDTDGTTILYQSSEYSRGGTKLRLRREGTIMYWDYLVNNKWVNRQSYSGITTNTLYNYIKVWPANENPLINPLHNIY